MALLVSTTKKRAFAETLFYYPCHYPCLKQKQKKSSATSTALSYYLVLLIDYYLVHVCFEGDQIREIRSNPSSSGLAEFTRQTTY